MRLFRSPLARTVVAAAFTLPVTIGLILSPLGIGIADAAVPPPIASTVSSSQSAQSAQTASPRAAAADSGLTVDAVPAASGVLREGDDLVIEVTISNNSPVTVPAGTAEVDYNRSITTSRSDLYAWGTSVSAAASTTGVSLATVATPELLSGEAVALQPIVIPAATLGISSATKFGVHEVAVRVASIDRELGEAHTSVTVNPGTVLPPTGVAVVVPLTVPGSTAGVLPGSVLEAETSVGGALYTQLEQVWGQPVAIAIDPRIIVSIRLLGTSAPSSALIWLERLRAAPNQTLPLSYADSDVSAVSQAGGGVLAPSSFAIDESLFQAVPTPSPSDTASPSPTPTPSAAPVAPTAPTLASLLAWPYTIADMAWPRESTVVAGDLSTFASAGLNTTILSSENTSAGTLSRTPNAATEVGRRSVVTSDLVLSHLFRDAVSATSTVDWQTTMTELTSAIGTISSEKGATARTMLATVGRDTPLIGSRLSQTLFALATIPGASQASLTEAVSSPPTSVTMVDLPVPASRLDTIRQLLASAQTLAPFASALDDPTALTGERTLALMALTSQGWIGSEDRLAPAIAEFVTRTTGLVSSIQVTSSTITLLADKEQLPITVRNSLDYPVTVYVLVTPQTATLAVLQPRVKVSLEANSQKRASVPVQSVANGEVVIRIALVSATNVVVAPETRVTINVQAGWETAATAVLGVLVLGLFALGIVRTVRRRRRTDASDSTA